MLSGCFGSDDARQPDDGESDAGDATSLIVVPGAGGQFAPDTMVTCFGGQPFPAGVLATPMLLADTQVAPGSLEPITEFLQTGEGDFWPQAGYWVLDNTSTSLLLAHIGPNQSVTILGSASSGGEWQTTELTSGQRCPISVPLPPGLGEVSWRIDPTNPPIAASTTVELLATGQTCSSGQPMGDRLEPPQVEVTPDAMYVLLVATDPVGDQECPGNPEEFVEVDFGEPLGDRQIINARQAGGLITDYLPLSPG